MLPCCYVAGHAARYRPFAFFQVILRPGISVSNMGLSENKGVPYFGGPYNKDPILFGVLYLDRLFSETLMWCTALLALQRSFAPVRRNAEHGCEQHDAEPRSRALYNGPGRNGICHSSPSQSNSSAQPDLHPDTTARSDADLLKALGGAGIAMTGSRFGWFPQPYEALAGAGVHQVISL